MLRGQGWFSRQGGLDCRGGVLTALFWGSVAVIIDGHARGNTLPLTWPMCGYSSEGSTMMEVVVRKGWFMNQYLFVEFEPREFNHLTAYPRLP